jgi:hypothetical protein
MKRRNCSEIAANRANLCWNDGIIRRLRAGRKRRNAAPLLAVFP